MESEKKYSLAIEKENKNLLFDDDGVHNITIEEGSEYNATFNVVCDGVKDRLSFMMEVYGEGITVIQNRCKINIHIDKNLTQEEKEFSIFFTHSNDMNEMLQLNFIQEPETFEITIESDDKEEYEDTEENEDDGQIKLKFLSYLEEEDKEEDGENEKEIKKNNVKRLNNSDVFYQDKVVKVTASGGSKKWRVLSVRRKISSTYKYYDYEVDENGNISLDDDGNIKKKNIITEQYEYYSTFDNEFVCIKKGDELIVRSYGKAFMDISNEDVEEVSHFEITVCHCDNKHITKVIKVYYEETNYTTEEIEIETPDNSIKHDELYVDLVNSKSDEEDDDEDNDEKQEEITYTLTIKNNNDDEKKDITIKEPVMEDSTNYYTITPSADYRCTTYTSAKWCSAEIIEKEDKKYINIKITDKPLLQRKCLVRVSIAAMTEVCADFIVINEPEVEKEEDTIS